MSEKKIGKALKETKQQQKTEHSKRISEKQVANEKKEPKEKKKKGSQEKKALKLRSKIKQKKHPVFRGRFGGRFKRRKSNEKWDKWRRPRGIDTIFKNEDGALPKIGYRVPKEIRFLHPSGYKEFFVSNAKDLQKIGEKKTEFVVRLSSGLGNKKRKEIAKLAKEQGIRILNR